jgi:hypothetical protein
MRGVFPARWPSLAGRRTSLSFGRVAVLPQARPIVSAMSTRSAACRCRQRATASFPLWLHSPAEPSEQSGGVMLQSSSVAPSPSSQPRKPASCACRQPGRAQEDEGESAPFRRRRQTLFGVSTENVIGLPRNPFFGASRGTAPVMGRQEIGSAFVLFPCLPPAKPVKRESAIAAFSTQGAKIPIWWLAATSTGFHLTFRASYIQGRRRRHGRP